ncbi:MAG: XdhC family protein [Chloroflexi bacterium]|nr:XdhC family protein [Chloroflexota bacterium]
MREIASNLIDWLEDGESIALATVVRAEGPSPRSPGSRLAVTASGRMAGSVSGGCVEGAVFEIAQQVIASRAPQQLHFEVADNTGWDVGLSCGGKIDVFVEPATPAHRLVLESLVTRETVAFATHLSLGTHLVLWPDGRQTGDASLTGALQGVLRHLHSQPRCFCEWHSMDQPDGHLFLEVFAPPPRILIVGAVHIAVPLVQMAKHLGFQTRVIDPRRTFGARERFPDVDELVNAWPQDTLKPEELGPQDYVVVLSHDPKFDVPALSIALRSEAAYIGLIGSRSTQMDRHVALSADGFTAKDIARIHGPIGLDLGGREPAHIALAILAEIVAVQHGRSGGMLSSLS